MSPDPGSTDRAQEPRRSPTSHSLVDRPIALLLYVATCNAALAALRLKVSRDTDSDRNTGVDRTTVHTRRVSSPQSRPPAQDHRNSSHGYGSGRHVCTR